VTRIAAHRGGAALWPENSLLAFEKAIALGSDLLELDVHLAGDGTIVVIHDATVDRTTGGRGAIASLTAADLRQLRLKGPDGAVTAQRVPAFDEVLALATGSAVGLLVEVKGPGPGVRYDGLEEKILTALTSAGLHERAAIMAFNPDVISRVRALAPRARTTLLVSRGAVERARARPEDTVEWARAAGVTDLGLEQSLVTSRVAAAARAAMLVLGVWTVNDEAAMRRVSALGVDILTTDRPDLAKRVLRGGA
jgi:glycerophosphoryl diester phosphodiesterase